MNKTLQTSDGFVDSNNPISSLFFKQKKKKQERIEKFSFRARTPTKFFIYIFFTLKLHKPHLDTAYRVYSAQVYITSAP